MPSVGMRRTTRVFGVVKAADGARVLRSGRRLWPNSGEPKVRRAHEVDDRDWDSILRDHGKGKSHKSTGSHGGRSASSGKRSKLSSAKQDSSQLDDKEDNFPVRKRKLKNNEAVGDEKSVGKMFGLVYRRKRKPSDDQESGFFDKPEDSSRSLKFYCRRRRVSDRLSGYRRVLTVVVDRSCGNCWFPSVFSLGMRYMKRDNLSLSSLTSFFLSQPINDVFSDHGVRFLLEPSVSLKGICKFFGARNRLPIFSVDFAADPHFFIDMSITLLLKMVHHSCAFVKKSVYLFKYGEFPVTEESNRDSAGVVTLGTCKSRNESVLGPHLSIRASKLAGGNAQYRGNVGSRSFQKRRSSLRRGRARNLSHGAHKLYNGALISDLSGSRKNGIKFLSTVSARKLRSSLMNNLASDSKDISSPKLRTKHELDSLGCSANLLLIDSDRCTREQGFDVMMEFSSSREWYLVVKRDGSIRYSHKAQRIMRPCSSNRFTHSIIWIGDDNWKLEFCNRQDWFVFKDIYKECYERNALDPNVKVIPIPGVREVHGFKEDIGDHPSFCRPVSYISMKEDEISRALARSSSAIYDMDSEDEEWLKTDNWIIPVEDKQYQQLPQHTFELMIDGFEKAYFQNPDDFSDEKAACSVAYLANQEVVDAVYNYWTRKRKQRNAPLLRVFQGHQAKKAPLISKPVFRKRRSFKRQASQLYGKASLPNPLHGMVKISEQDASEEQTASAAFLRAEEAKASADISMEVAIAKRLRSQLLAENADLAIYKAMMALRITEAIRVAESSETTAATLLLN